MMSGHNGESVVNNGPVKAEENVCKETHSLYGHGVCKWPGCDTPCDDLPDFGK